MGLFDFFRPKKKGRKTEKKEKSNMSVTETEKKEKPSMSVAEYVELINKKQTKDEVLKVVALGALFVKADSSWAFNLAKLCGTLDEETHQQARFFIPMVLKNGGRGEYQTLAI